DPALSSDPPPQRRYMGVRVKMPVRELLRKVRLSRGLEAAPSQDISCLTSLPHLPPSPLLLLCQSKQSIGQTLKGLEDLDILVEVLQEDLNKSQLRKESLHTEPDGCWPGFPAELQAWRGGAAGSRQAAGPQERCQGLSRSRSHCCFMDCSSAPQQGVEASFRDAQKNMQEPDSPGVFSRTREKESCWWMQGTSGSAQRDSWRHPAQGSPPCPSPCPLGSPRALLEAAGCSPGTAGRCRLTAAATQQDLSAISFFQFQLHREESLLRNIPADKLLAPDENGNRLLHKAVAQGRRALTYALARRFASLNKIDEKDAEKRTALHLAAEKNQHLMVSDLISLGANVNEQDSLGRTALHLCAENGYLRVLKNCKDNGVRVEANLTDHYGLTPLHCAALAHTILAMETQNADTDTGRFLRLRKDQILEGIHCLLQM
ncbi:IKBZ inhibitor, partial [Penelope pileata]|nr:IKBZ inhibitor [Penelope pileata]